MNKYIFIFCLLSIPAFAAGTQGNISANVLQPITINNSGAVTGEQPIYCDTDAQGNIMCYY